jgi:hypothetical protein
MRAMKIFAFAIIVVALAVPAFAQQVDIRATPPAPERPDFVTPGPQLDITEPRENQWYPEGVRVPYDPAFIAPFSTEYETPTTRGQYGVAGWSSQNLPVGPTGAMYREQAGWLSFGFAFTWGAPPRRVAPAAKPASVPRR